CKARCAALERHQRSLTVTAVFARGIPLDEDGRGPYLADGVELQARVYHELRVVRRDRRVLQDEIGELERQRALRIDPPIGPSVALGVCAGSRTPQGLELIFERAILPTAAAGAAARERTAYAEQGERLGRRARWRLSRRLRRAAGCERERQGYDA